MGLEEALRLTCNLVLKEAVIKPDQFSMWCANLLEPDKLKKRKTKKKKKNPTSQTINTTKPKKPRKHFGVTTSCVCRHSIRAAGHDQPCHTWFI